jgi:hypothetical protein
MRLGVSPLQWLLTRPPPEHVFASSEAQILIDRASNKQHQAAEGVDERRRKRNGILPAKISRRGIG